MSFVFYKEVSFKGTPIGNIPQDWEVAKITKLFDLYKGTTPSTKIKEYWNGNIPFVTPTDVTKISDMNGIYLETTENYITEKGLKSKGLKLVPKGSILFTSRATIGYLAINKTEVAINQGIISLIPKRTNVDVTFFCYFLQKLKDLFENLAGGSTYKEISMSTFSNVDIAIPPFSEQQKIAQILLTVDKAIRKTNEIIAKTERLKKGLMQELLTKGLTLGFMFDTNVFDAIIDKRIDLAQLPRNLKYYVTHIQYDEICNTQDEERRRELLEIMKKVPNEVIATEGAVYGVSKYGMAKYMSEADAKLYYEMLRRLKELDEKAGKKKPVENQARDVLIALTSIKNCLVLVTEDKNLKKVTEEFNGQAITFEQFQKGEYKEFRDTEMGRVPKHWKVVKLGDVVTYRKGVKPKVVFDQREPNTLPYLTADDVRAGIFTKWAKESDKTIKVNKDDVILIWDGFYCGDAFIGLEGILSSTMIKIESKSNLNGRFLFYILKTHFKELNTKISGMYLKHVNKSVFENLKLPLPPLQEQQKIAEILSIVDRKLEVERNEKAKLERIKQGLMDLLLTGKIRVKVS
jgi:restriction endonuclease S subunit